MDYDIDIPESIKSILKTTSVGSNIENDSIDDSGTKETEDCDNCVTSIVICDSCDVSVNCTSGCNIRCQICNTGCELCDDGCQNCDSCQNCNTCQSRCEVGSQIISERLESSFSFPHGASKNGLIYHEDWNALIDYTYEAYIEDWREGLSLSNCYADKNDIFYADMFNSVNIAISNLENGNTGIDTQLKDFKIYDYYFNNMADALNKATIQNIACKEDASYPNCTTGCQHCDTCQLCDTGCQDCNTGCQLCNSGCEGCNTAQTHVVAIPN